MKEIVQLHLSGRLDEAAAAYRELLSREPGNVDGLRLYAVLQRQRGDLAEATRLLETARTLLKARVVEQYTDRRDGDDDADE